MQRKLNIKQKFMVIVAFMVAAMAAIGTLSLVYISATSRAMVALRDQELPALLLASDSCALFRLYTKDIEAAVSLGEPALLQENRRLIVSLQENLSRLSALSPADFASMSAQDDRDVAAFATLAEQFVNSAVNPRTDRDTNVKLGHQAQDQSALISGRLEELKTLANQRFLATIEKTRVQSKRAATLQPSLGFLMILLTLVMTLAILRSILGRMRLIAGHFANSDLDQIEPLMIKRADDELDALVDASNAMLTSFKTSRSALIEKNFADNVIASLVDLLIVVSSDGQIVRANPVTEKVLGYTEAELKACDVSVLFRNGGLAKGPGVMSELEANGASVHEAMLLAKDGAQVPALVSAAPLIDKHGAFIGAVFSIKDMTAVRQSEAAKHLAEEQLIQASKLAAIGTLGAGVAHELNNPLVAVKGYAEMVLASDTQSPESADRLRKIVRAAERMQKITDHLRSFASDTSHQEHTPISVADPVADSFILLEQRIRTEGVAIVIQMPEALPLIDGDHNQLESVFQNMITNSLDAFREQKANAAKRISIEATATPDGSQVRLCYQDNAGGIPEHVRDRIFEAFFTTKPVGKGTGLGLSISHEIVAKHQGHLRLLTSPPGTTVFEIVLPSSKTATGFIKIAAQPAITAAASALALGAEAKAANRAPRPRVLIVDDEEMVVEILAAFLGSAFDVDPTTDPRVALAKIRTESYTAIVSDMRMPIITGYEILEAARSACPDVPVAIITGHANFGEERGKALAAGASLVVAKPLPTQEALVRMIQEMIQDMIQNTAKNAQDKVKDKERIPPMKKAKEEPTGARVLVIDDECDVCDILRIYLEPPFQVETFTDPVAAMKRISEQRFDVVLTDLGMQQATGLDILGAVRAHYPEVPVLIVTGYSEHEPEVLRAKAAGAAGVVAKPFADQATMVEQISEHLARAKKSAA